MFIGKPVGRGTRLRILPAEKMGDVALLFLFNKFACANRKLPYSNRERTCALFSSVTLQQPTVALQLPCRGDVSLSLTPQAAARGSGF